LARETVRVRGLREFQRAAARAGKESRTEVRAALREAAEPVRSEAVALFTPVDARSAAGYRVAVRQRGVAVEQRLRKTTGRRPQYGALQMTRALLPALKRHEHTIERRVERALDRIADHFERKP
jgi:hypothetical protein